MTNRRNRTKYPNLQRKMNLKRRQELIDFDYLHKLNDEEKTFLDKFMGEYMGASFPKQEITTKNGTTYKRHSTKNLHKNHQTKEIYDLNNARNRDIYVKKASTGGMEFFDEVELDDLREKDMNADINAFEDSIADADLLIKDKTLYKIEVLEYIASFKNKKDRDAEIEYYISIGQGWIFE